MGPAISGGDIYTNAEERTMAPESWEYRISSLPIGEPMPGNTGVEHPNETMNDALRILIDDGWEPIGMTGDRQGNRAHLLLRKIRGFTF